jgi:hypothetical protein
MKSHGNGSWPKFAEQQTPTVKWPFSNASNLEMCMCLLQVCFFYLTRAAKLDRTRLVPQISQIPTLGSAIATFDKALMAVTSSHAGNAATLLNLDLERQSLQTQEDELRKMVADAETKRSWFAEFRDWVETIGAFLDEKVWLFTR